MRTSSAALAAFFWSSSILARPQIPGQTLTGTAGNTTIAGSSAGPDSNGKYVIEGVGIRATFIPYGASISNLFINDTSGVERDLVTGFDNASYYGIVSSHHFVVHLVDWKLGGYFWGMGEVWAGRG
jgi:aldose 1-epimerase